MTRTAPVLAVALILGCGGGDGAPDASTAPDAAAQGTLEFDWVLTTPAADALLCEDVAAVTVQVTATPAVGGFGQVDAFTCSQGTGTTRGLDPATYNVSFRLGATGGSLAADVVMNGVVVTAGQSTDLGNITFEVDPVGGFHFRVNAGSEPNCDLVGDGGAGITTLEMELIDADDICAPTTFCIGDTDTAAGCQGTAYDNDCGGATTACIDDDVIVTVEDALSGPHHLQITGYRDLETCYSRDSQIVIPGNNLDRDLGSQDLMLVCGIDAGS